MTDFPNTLENGTIQGSVESLPSVNLTIPAAKMATVPPTIKPAAKCFTRVLHRHNRMYRFIRESRARRTVKRAFIACYGSMSDYYGSMAEYYDHHTRGEIL